MKTRQKFYLLACASLLAACSGDVAGIENKRSQQAGTTTEPKDEGIPHEGVNKCAVYQTAYFCDM
ncbi:MAG TPA: hypothetical protein VM100_14515 [Longimicrobiales bacterium]|nr:hypothetical protein [Longimicrobiales bacterium]